MDDGPPHPHPEHPEWVQITTKVYGPNHEEGWIERSYDASNKMIIMENAFLDKLPRWIHAGVAMDPAKGTPLVAYLTLRHMKMLGAGFGEMKTIKMSTIQNVEAVMQLERFERDGLSRAEAVRKTHSVTYASTSVQQSGHTITTVRIDETSAFRWRLDKMMDHFRFSKTRRQELLDKYGLQKTDMMLVNYDIYLDLSPYPKSAT